MFHLTPVSGAAIFAQIARRAATSLEVVQGGRALLLNACGTIAGAIIGSLTVVAPAIFGPVPHALAVGLLEFIAAVLLTVISLRLSAPWFYAWIPSIIPVLMVSTLSQWRDMIDRQVTRSATMIIVGLITAVIVNCVGGIRSREVFSH